MLCICLLTLQLLCNKMCSVRAYIHSIPSKCNDTIYDIIKLPPEIRKILSSPYMNRMMRVKQTGCANYIYNNATHTRYSHMIGTYHLANQFMTQLKGVRREKGDMRHVCIAALLHDIGHAPFSHAFETNVWKRLYPSEVWNHEMQCDAIIEWLYDNDFLAHDINTRRVKALIQGMPLEGDKQYMYQIVCNETNCIDVDKFDYLRRDSEMIFGESFKNSVDMLMLHPRVINGNICYPFEYKDSVVDIFQTRMKFWNKVYMHPKVKAIEYMAADAILAANHVFPVWEHIKDIGLFVDYDDTILDTIFSSNDTTLKDSKDIIQRMRSGNYYMDVGRFVDVPVPTYEDLLKFNKGKLVKAEDFIIHSFKLNYGKKKNPVYDVGLYVKEKKSRFVEKKMPNSTFMPVEAEERYVQFYCKKNELYKDVQDMVEAWHKSLGLF